MTTDTPQIMVVRGGLRRTGAARRATQRLAALPSPAEAPAPTITIVRGGAGQRQVATTRLPALRQPGVTVIRGAKNVPTVAGLTPPGPLVLRIR